MPPYTRKLRTSQPQCLLQYIFILLPNDLKQFHPFFLVYLNIFIHLFIIFLQHSPHSLQFSYPLCHTFKSINALSLWSLNITVPKYKYESIQGIRKIVLIISRVFDVPCLLQNPHHSHTSLIFSDFPYASLAWETQIRNRALYFISQFYFIIEYQLIFENLLCYFSH